MQKFKVGKYEKIVLSVGVSIFVIFMSVVMIKPEWITNTINNVRSSEVDYTSKKDDNGSKKNDEEEKKKTDLIVDKGDKKIKLKVNLEEALQVSGVELYLETGDTTVKEIICSEGFNCVKKKIKDDNTVEIALMQSPDKVEEYLQGEVLLVTMEYKGSGDIRVQKDSFISSLNEGSIYFN